MAPQHQCDEATADTDSKTLSSPSGLLDCCRWRTGDSSCCTRLSRTVPCSRVLASCPAPLAASNTLQVQSEDVALLIGAVLVVLLHLYADRGMDCLLATARARVCACCIVKVVVFISEAHHRISQRGHCRWII